MSQSYNLAARHPSRLPRRNNRTSKRLTPDLPDPGRLLSPCRSSATSATANPTMFSLHSQTWHTSLLWLLLILSPIVARGEETVFDAGQTLKPDRSTFGESLTHVLFAPGFPSAHRPETGRVLSRFRRHLRHNLSTGPSRPPRYILLTISRLLPMAHCSLVHRRAIFTPGILRKVWVTSAYKFCPGTVQLSGPLM